MVRVVCPHCAATGTVEASADTLGAAPQVQCFACGQPFSLQEAILWPQTYSVKAIRKLRRRAAKRLRTPARLLSVITLLQFCFHVVVVVIAVWDRVTLPGAPDEASQSRLLIFGGVGIALIIKDIIVFLSINAIEKRRDHQLAHTGAAFALCPDIAWAISAPLAIWLLVTLGDPKIKIAFNAADDLPAAPDETVAREHELESTGNTEDKRDHSLSRSNRKSTRKKNKSTNIRGTVRPVAVLLFLGWLLHAAVTFLLVISTAVAVFWGKAPVPGVWDERLAMIAICTCAVPVTWLGLTGSWSALHLRDRWLVMTSAILFMFCSLGCVAGLGIGVWAVITFSRAEVVRAFRMLGRIRSATNGRRI